MSEIKLPNRVMPHTAMYIPEDGHNYHQASSEISRQYREGPNSPPLEVDSQDAFAAKASPSFTKVEFGVPDSGSGEQPLEQETALSPTQQAFGSVALQ